MWSARRVWLFSVVVALGLRHWGRQPELVRPRDREVVGLGVSPFDGGQIVIYAYRYTSGRSN